MAERRKVDRGEKGRREKREGGRGDVQTILRLLMQRLKTVGQLAVQSLADSVTFSRITLSL